MVSLLFSDLLVDAEPPPSTKVEQNPHCAHVRYTPTIQQQRNTSPRGLNADFVIHYDVELKDPMGDIQVFKLNHPIVSTRISLHIAL